MADRMDVAKAAGVSTATVTRVTSGRGYVSAAARERVEKAIRELNYQPNQVARNLRMKKSNVIAVLAEDIVNPYYSESIEAMITEARKYGCVVSLFVLTDRDLDALLEEICQNRMAGLVNLTLIPFRDRHFARLSDLSVRMVNISDVELVRMDYESGMRDAYVRLKARGRKRLAFLCGVPYSFAAQDGRLQAYRKLNAEFGMENDDALVVDGDYPEQKYYDLGYKGVCELISRGVAFDGVVCMTDIIAPGAIRALTEHGFRIPEDVSVLGCDNIGLSSAMNPALSTIDTFGTEIARIYIRYLMGETDELPVPICSKYVERSSL